jgi:hypothetical protein
VQGCELSNCPLRDPARVGSQRLQSGGQDRVGAGTSGFGRVRWAAALVGAALLLTASGTIVGLTASQRGTGRGGAPDAGGTAVRGAAGAPRATITPRDGAIKARPDLGAVVTVAEGTLNDVSVRSKGTSVPGDLSSDHASWRTRWTLVPGRLYAVRATATSPNGRTTTASSTFTTQPALQTIAVSDVTPALARRSAWGCRSP